MADHTIDRSFHGSLPVPPGLVTFTSDGDRSTAVIYNRGVDPLFVRLDGVDPTTDGTADGDLVVPGNTVRSFTVPNATEPDIRVAGAVGLQFSVELT